MNENAQENCWRNIGVTGSRTCERLAEVVHCHNCPRYLAASRALFEREAPPGYRDEWTRVLAKEHAVENTANESVLAFRIGAEWLALPLHLARQVTELRPLHRLPHHPPTLAGLVNVNGELLLCCALERLLHVAPGEEPGKEHAARDTRRLLVIARGEETWCVQVDEVLGVVLLNPDEIQPIPSTLTGTAAHARGLLPLNGRPLVLLNEELLFRALARSLK